MAASVIRQEFITSFHVAVISSVQPLSRVRLFATPWITARQASLSITNSRSLLKLMSMESVMPPSHLILCRPLLLLPPIPPIIRVFSNKSTLHMRWPKCWSFSYHITVIIYLPVNTFISVSVALSRQLFSHSVMSRSLRLYGLQHTRLPCPSLSPGVCSNSCPLSQWCHPTISSSVFPFSSHLQSFPASGTFPMSWLFTSDGPSIESLASASVLPINIQSWFPLGLTGSPCRPCSPRDSLKSSPTPQCKSISSLVFSLLYGPALTSVHHYWGNHSFNYTDLCLQNYVSALSGLVIAFHPRSKHLLIWWLQSLSAVILEPKKIKSVPVSIVSPSILHEMMEWMPWS